MEWFIRTTSIAGTQIPNWAVETPMYIRTCVCAATSATRLLVRCRAFAGLIPGWLGPHNHKERAPLCARSLSERKKPPRTGGERRGGQVSVLVRMSAN
jgi:hypothetical protein